MSLRGVFFPEAISPFQPCHFEEADVAISSFQPRHCKAPSAWPALRSFNVAISSFQPCHCEEAGGRRGNPLIPTTSLQRHIAPGLHCVLSVWQSPMNSTRRIPPSIFHPDHSTTAPRMADPRASYCGLSIIRRANPRQWEGLLSHHT